MPSIHPNVQEFQQFAERNNGNDNAIATKFQTTFHTAAQNYSTTHDITEILDIVFTVLSFSGKNTPLIAAFINVIKTCEDIRILKYLHEAWELIMQDCKEKNLGKIIKGNLDMRLNDASIYTQQGLGGYPGHANHTQVAVKPHTGQAAHAQAAFKTLLGGAGPPQSFLPNPGHVNQAQRFLSRQSALATQTFGGMGFGQPAIPTQTFGGTGFGKPAYLPTETFGGAGFDRPEEDNVESLTRRLAVAKESAERQRQNKVVATSNLHVQSLATATDARFNESEADAAASKQLIATLQSALVTLTGQVNGLVDDQATQATKTAAVERANDKNALGISEVNARVDQSDAKANRAAEATENTNALLARMMQAAEAKELAKEARREAKEAERHAESLANKAAAERAAAARYAPTNPKAPVAIRPAKTMNKRDRDALERAMALVAKHAPVEPEEEAREAEAAFYNKSDDDDELDMSTGKPFKKPKNG